MRERIYVVVFMIVLGLVAAVVLTAANALLKPMYDVNKERESKGNVLIALGIEGWNKDRVAVATIDDIKAAFDKSIIERKVRITTPGGAQKDVVYYEGYRTEAKTKADLIGYAFKITGAGFWDRISGYLAVDAKLETVIGITFYEDIETPGLGHKINEPEWQRQFLGRSIYKAGTDIPRLDIVPPSSELKANQVHAISGATETCTAVQKFTNSQLRDFVVAVKEYTKGDQSSSH